jgi:hypothetical protein
MRFSLLTICALPAAVVLLNLSACSPEPAPDADVITATESLSTQPEQAAADTSLDAGFADYSESLMQRMLERNLEWSLFSGRYDDAHRVTLPDESRRADDLLFIDAELAQLAQFDPLSLSPALRDRKSVV